MQAPSGNRRSRSRIFISGVCAGGDARRLYNGSRAGSRNSGAPPPAGRDARCQPPVDRPVTAPSAGRRGTGRAPRRARPAVSAIFTTTAAGSSPSPSSSRLDPPRMGRRRFVVGRYPCSGAGGGPAAARRGRGRRGSVRLPDLWRAARGGAGGGAGAAAGTIRPEPSRGDGMLPNCERLSDAEILAGATALLRAGACRACGRSTRRRSRRQEVGHERAARR